MLNKLDTDCASYFRVFWLELALMSDNHVGLRSAGVNIDTAMTLLDDGRKFYLKKLIDDEGRALRNSPSKPYEMSDLQCMEKAKKNMLLALSRAYFYWFGYDQEMMSDKLASLLEEVSDGQVEAVEAETEVPL